MRVTQTLFQAAPSGIMACVSGIHSLHDHNSVDQVRDYNDASWAPNSTNCQ